MTKTLSPMHTSRFMTLFSPEPNTGCWLWTGALSPTDYGLFRAGGAHYRAHRASWEIHHGPIPASMSVCHRCDVRACVNPAHLWLGSHLENMHDRSSKGRTLRGAQQRAAKLDDIKVIEARRIHAQGISQRSLARLLGVDQKTLGNAIRGKSWTHLKDGAR